MVKSVKMPCCATQSLQPQKRQQLQAWIRMKNVSTAVHRSLPQFHTSVLAIYSDIILADCVPQVCKCVFLALQMVVVLLQVRRAFLEPMARCIHAFSHPMPRLIN